MQLFGAILLILGSEEAGAGLLLMFAIPSTFTMHAYWLLPDAQQPLAMQHFIKNIAIIGALLFVHANAAQRNASVAQKS